MYVVCAVIIIFHDELETWIYIESVFVRFPYVFVTSVNVRVLRYLMHTESVTPFFWKRTNC